MLEERIQQIVRGWGKKGVRAWLLTPLSHGLGTRRVAKSGLSEGRSERVIFHLFVS